MDYIISLEKKNKNELITVVYVCVLQKRSILDKFRVLNITLVISKMFSNVHLWLVLPFHISKTSTISQSAVLSRQLRELTAIVQNWITASWVFSKENEGYIAVMIGKHLIPAKMCS